MNKESRLIASALLTITLTVLAGCGDGAHLNTEPPNVYPGPSEKPTSAVTDYYVSPTCADCVAKVEMQAGGGLRSVLGRGYDVTGAYLASSSVRNPVIDLDKQDNLNLLVVMSAPMLSQGTSFSCENAGELLNTLTLNAGLDEYLPSTCFNGTISASSPNTSYILSFNGKRETIGRVNSTRVNLLRTLTDEFKSDLKTMRPDALVDKYGTHFLVSAEMGIAEYYLYSAYVYAEDEEKIGLLKSGCSAARAYLFGSLADDGSSTSVTGLMSQFNNYGGTLTCTLHGGDQSLINYDKETGILGTDHGWSNSENSGNLSLLSLSRGDLLPLSAAIDDDELAAEVELAIRRHIKSGQVDVNATIPLVQNSNGTTYRYVAGFEESKRLESKENLKSHGMLGCLHQTQVAGSIPLYSNIDESGCQMLSLIQPTSSWKRIGYVMKERSESTIQLYEITDGKRYAYTIEAANSYGTKGEWHPTGVVFRLVRP